MPRLARNLIPSSVMFFKLVFFGTIYSLFILFKSTKVEPSALPDQPHLWQLYKPSVVLIDKHKSL